MLKLQKHTLAGQQKKTPDKGKARPIGKMKKNVAKTTPITWQVALLLTLQSQLTDKAKHTAAINTGDYRRTPDDRGRIFTGRSGFRCHSWKWPRTRR